MSKAIALVDIDDCLFGNINTWAGLTKPKDNFKLFKINVNRLKLVCEKWDIDIQIISSMSAELNHYPDENRLDYIFEYMEIEKDSDSVKIVKYLNKKLSKHIVSLSSGDKMKDIANAIKHEGYEKVIVIDDTDFSSMVTGENNLFIQSNGYLSGNDIFKIRNLMEN